MKKSREFAVEFYIYNTPACEKGRFNLARLGLDLS